MKKLWLTCLISGAVGGALAAGSEKKADIQVLDKKWAVQMDADQDGRVSENEYVDFAVETLKKRGRQADRIKLLTQFDGYDRDRDGYITDADPVYRDPRELLEERIKGRWMCAKNASGATCFVFMENGQADIIQKGESIREKAAGKVKYRFVHPTKTPVHLSITVAAGTPSEYQLKCIISFVSDDVIKMRAFTGNSLTPFPKRFVDGYDKNTLLLSRET